MNTHRAWAETGYRLRKELKRLRLSLAHCTANPGGLGRLMLQTIPDDIARIEDELRLRRKLGSNKARAGGQWREI